VGLTVTETTAVPPGSAIGFPTIPVVKVATNSLQRSGDKALGIWKEITSGDYEPKHVVRDTALFWADATKDVAKAFVLVRDFLAKAADESEADAAQ